MVERNSTKATCTQRMRDLAVCATELSIPLGYLIRPSSYKFSSFYGSYSIPYKHVKCSAKTASSLENCVVYIRVFASGADFGGYRSESQVH